MKMSIEESLEWLISRKEHYEMDDNCQELAQALDVAIDTMNKCQKIQKIVEHWACCGNPSDSMIAISEVLEDENDG
jgi:hypothetical protein